MSRWSGQMNLPSSVASVLSIKTQCIFDFHTLSHLWTSLMFSRLLLSSFASLLSSPSPSSTLPLISAIPNSSMAGLLQAHLMSTRAQVFFHPDLSPGCLPGTPYGKPRFARRAGILAWAKMSLKTPSKNVHLGISGERTSRRFVFYFFFFSYSNLTYLVVACSRYYASYGRPPTFPTRTYGSGVARQFLCPLDPPTSRHSGYSA